MLCDPMQVAACRAMVGYCDGAGGVDATMHAIHGACPHHYWPATPVPIDQLEEDPDLRPYVWDLECDRCH